MPNGGVVEGSALLFVVINVVFVVKLFRILIGLNVVVALLIVLSVNAFSVVPFDFVVLRRLTVVTDSEVESVGPLVIFSVVGKVVVSICVVFVMSNCVVLTAGLAVVLNSDVLLEVSVVLMLRLTSVPLKMVTFTGISVVLNKVVFIGKAVVFDCVMLTVGLAVVLYSDVLLELSVVLMLRVTSVPLKMVTFSGMYVVLNKVVFIGKAVVFDCVVLNRGSVMLGYVTSGKKVELKVVKLSVFIVVLTCGVYVVVSVPASVVSIVELFRSCVLSYGMAVVLNSVVLSRG